MCARPLGKGRTLSVPFHFQVDERTVRVEEEERLQPFAWHHPTDVASPSGGTLQKEGKRANYHTRVAIFLV